MFFVFMSRRRPFKYRVHCEHNFFPPRRTKINKTNRTIQFFSGPTDEQPRTKQNNQRIQCLSLPFTKAPCAAGCCCWWQIEGAIIIMGATKIIGTQWCWVVWAHNHIKICLDAWRCKFARMSIKIEN